MFAQARLGRPFGCLEERVFSFLNESILKLLPPYTEIKGISLAFKRSISHYRDLIVRNKFLLRLWTNAAIQPSNRNSSRNKDKFNLPKNVRCVCNFAEKCVREKIKIIQLYQYISRDQHIKIK